MLAQLLSVGIFLGMFCAMVSGKAARYLVTLVAGGLTLLLVFLVVLRDPAAIWDVFNLDHFSTLSFWYAGSSPGAGAQAGINWSTILFIAGMMVLVAGMGEAGFFDWLCLRLARVVHYRPAPLLVGFMLLSALLSMFIDSITVLLFLAAASVQLAHLLHFDPVPLILAEIFTANLGGAATMCGDPPNIIIGTALGFTFGDFLQNTGRIVLVCLLFTLPYFFFCFRMVLPSGAKPPSPCPNPREAIPHRGHFFRSTVIFLFIVLLLITHGQTGLTVATIGTLAAMLTVLTTPSGLRILRRIDWKTLLFLVGLFLSVSGLEKTGVLQAIAQGIAVIGQGHPTGVLILLLWFSAIASAFLDNIPFAATMVPVITSLAATQGFLLTDMAWALSLGTDIGGSATPIGASANVVGTAIAAREGHEISWGRYCRYAVPATCLVLLLCTALLLLGI